MLNIDIGIGGAAAGLATAVCAALAFIFVRGIWRGLRAGPGPMDFNTVSPALADLFRKRGIGPASTAVSIGAGYPANLSEWEQSLVACGAKVLFVSPPDIILSRLLARLPERLLLKWEPFIGKLRAEGKNVSRIPLRLERAELPEKCAAVIVAMSVFSDPNLGYKDKLPLAREMKRVLKPGGLIVLGYFSGRTDPEKKRHERGLMALRDAGLSWKKEYASGESGRYAWTAFEINPVT